MGKFSSSGVGKQRNEMLDLISNCHGQRCALPVTALQSKKCCLRPLLFEKSKSLVRNCAERGRRAQTVLTFLWRGITPIQPSCNLHSVVHVNLSFCFLGNTKVCLQGTSALVSISAPLMFYLSQFCFPASSKWLQESIAYSLEQLLAQTRVLTGSNG